MWQGPLAVPGGDRQSPIDIVVRKSIFDGELKPLVTSYDPHTCQQIWNNGYSFLVEYDDTTDKSSKCFWNSLKQTFKSLNKIFTHEIWLEAAVFSLNVC